MPLAEETISAGRGKETDVGIADKYVVPIDPLPFQPHDPEKQVSVAVAHFNGKYAV